MTPPGIPDSLVAVLTAYGEKRLTADQAAKAILDAVARGGGGFGLGMDSALREAVAREARARGQPD